MDVYLAGKGEILTSDQKLQKLGLFLLNAVSNIFAAGYLEHYSHLIAWDSSFLSIMSHTAVHQVSPHTELGADPMAGR